LGAGRLGMYGYNPRLAHWLRDAVKQFDAVVISGIWMYHTLAASTAAIKAAIPYFVYVHGALDPWFRRRYPTKHVKKALYWKLVEARVFRRAARIVFTSEEERILARNAFEPYHCEEKVIAYGTARPPVATDQQRREFRATIADLGDRPYLLYLGRLHEKKGIDLLVKAFSREPLLAATHLLIAGPGESARTIVLREMAEKSPAKDRIHWIGPVYGEQKWAALRGADALVLPSHCENFGISIAEALGCGVPVLISNKVNTWREIESSAAGFVDEDDDAGTARLLRNWAAAPVEKKDAMRATATRCFERHFLIDRGAEQLYRELLEVTRLSSNNR
jgi:glycosyltransferase involved in cell wall biosynthesis